VSSPTRWAGVPLSDRRAERRALLVAAGFALFGTLGEAAVTVRSVCRESGLNSRYFYESFANTDELLGAVYDHVFHQLAEAVATAIEAAGEDRAEQTRAWVRAILGFSAADPRRGRLLFTDARTNSVLAVRRELTQDLLVQMVIVEDQRRNPDADPVSGKVGAAMFAGAMIELVHQWLAGRLGSDLEAVLAYTVKRVLII